MTLSLEEHRKAKTIGSSLEAAPNLDVSPATYKNFDGLDAAEVFRTSAATLKPDAMLSGHQSRSHFSLASGHKCERCWKILPEVTAPKFLCERCEDAVADWETRHAH